MIGPAFVRLLLQLATCLLKGKKEYVKIMYIPWRLETSSCTGYSMKRGSGEIEGTNNGYKCWKWVLKNQRRKPNYGKLEWFSGTWEYCAYSEKLLYFSPEHLNLATNSIQKRAYIFHILPATCKHVGKPLHHLTYQLGHLHKRAAIPSYIIVLYSISRNKENW